MESLKKIKILSVDDQPSVCELIDKYFKNNGYMEKKGYEVIILNKKKGASHIRGYDDLKKYLDTLKSTEVPDFIILDWNFDDNFHEGNQVNGKEILKYLILKKRKSIMNSLKNGYNQLEIIIMSNILQNKAILLEAFFHGAIAAFSKSIIEDTDKDDFSENIVTIIKSKSTGNEHSIIGSYTRKLHRGIKPEINKAFDLSRNHIYSGEREELPTSPMIPLRIENILKTKDKNDGPDFRLKTIFESIGTGKTLTEIQKMTRYPNFAVDKAKLINILMKENKNLEINPSDMHLIMLEAVRYRIPVVVEHFKNLGIII